MSYLSSIQNELEVADIELRNCQKNCENLKFENQRLEKVRNWKKKRKLRSNNKIFHLGLSRSNPINREGPKY